MNKIAFIVLMLCSYAGLAQDEEAHKADDKVKGLVKKMHVLGYMVRMVDDSLVYGEKWTDHTCFYDDNSRLVRSYNLSENKPPDTSYHYYLYNDDGKLISKRTERKKNSLYAMVYVYAGDTLKEEGLREKSGKVYSEYKYVYTGDSVQKLASYDTTGKVRAKDVFKYDKKHNVIQKDRYSLGKLYVYITYEYDLFDNIVLSKYFTKNQVDDIYTYEYEYDEHHNFIKRTEYKNKRIYNITTRIIEYQ